MKEQKISVYRVLPMLGMIVSILAATGVLCLLNKNEIDEIICIAFLIIGFLPIGIFELAYERNRGLIGNNEQTTYGRLAIGVFISSVVLVAISFMPEYFRPVILIPLIVAAFSNESIAIITALLFNCILTMTTSGSFLEVLSYTILVIIGALFSKALKENEYRIYIAGIFVCSGILFPNIFYYLANEEIVLSNLLFGIVNGIIIVIYTVFIFPKNVQETEEEVLHRYERFLEEDYVQVRVVRNYSWIEYCHAKKVSDIAYKYAKRLGFKAELAGVAGFYYRIGRWEGEPVVENAIKKAHELCFPQELIDIISEYNGEQKLPSTPESALVHIIDALIIKLELLETEVGTSQWNREVLIHQTLNEFSTAGLYDNSGLSINAFIKIREWLAKEESL